MLNLGNVYNLLHIASQRERREARRDENMHNTVDIHCTVLSIVLLM